MNGHLVSVQVCNSANACFCVYVSISVSIFLVSDLISVTERKKNSIHYFLFLKFVTCIDT